MAAHALRSDQMNMKQIKTARQADIQKVGNKMRLTHKMRMPNTMRMDHKMRLTHRVTESWCKVEIGFLTRRGSLIGGGKKYML
jgi:hypothetical protein